MTVNRVSMFKNYRIPSGQGRPEPESKMSRELKNVRALLGYKDPTGPVDSRPDPNPVKTTRDHLGNVTKMEYQAQPTGRISPHLPEEAEG